MSILFFEGFETCSTALGLANQATSRPNVEKRFDLTVSGTPATDSFYLINDDFSEGFALSNGDVEATLKGALFGGTLIQGTDSVRIVP